MNASTAWAVTSKWVTILTEYERIKSGQTALFSTVHELCEAHRIHRKDIRKYYERWIKAMDVLHALAELFILRAVPENLRSDNGSEFTAEMVRDWLGRLGVKTLFFEAGSPWENGYIESFSGKLRNELLNGEIFDTVMEARVIAEQWRKHYNTVRPHSALGYQPPVPETYVLR